MPSGMVLDRSLGEVLLKHGSTNADPASAPSRRVRVLIAHDDAALRNQLTTILHASDYEVEEVRNGASLQDSVQRGAFDLVLLGIKTRGITQVIERCRRVRSLAPGSGIVFVSSKEQEGGSGPDRRADALEAGADDYITATVESREFLARIRAVLRRIRAAESPKRLVKAGDLEMDIERRYLRQNGKPIHLTRTEFDLLSLIMQKPGTSFTHAQILRSVWGPEYGSELEYLRAYIRLLRRKIDDDPVKPSHIRTVPGVGYCFQAPVDI
jgi:two-component system KDP operon response regulator KdpE